LAGFDLSRFAPQDAYGFLMSAVVPRPIALVTTSGPAGIVNAAPFSSFIALSPKPPMVGVIVGGWEGRRKDTLANVERTGQFVANAVTEAMAEAVQGASAELPPDESEVSLLRLATAPSTVVAPPRIAESPIAFECVLDRLVPLGDAPDRLLVGRVVWVHVQDALWRDGRIDGGAWRPLGRVGGGAFCRLGEGFRVAAPAGVERA
jgi:flavin reductase (DIM6/NTAB) family NADH-FMN oxidoreductase RutF